MRKRKLLTIVLAIVLITSVPLTYAALTYQQTIDISGTTRYPLNPFNTNPTSTPIPTVSTSQENVKFTLFLPNETELQSAWVNPKFIAVTRNVDNEKGFSTTEPDLLLKNTGSKPLNVNVKVENVQVPSDIKLEFFYEVINVDGSKRTTPVAVGETVALLIVVYLAPTTQNYESQGTLNYNFRLVVSATES